MKKPYIASTYSTQHIHSAACDNKATNKLALLKHLHSEKEHERSFIIHQCTNHKVS